MTVFMKPEQFGSSLQKFGIATNGSFNFIGWIMGESEYSFWAFTQLIILCPKEEVDHVLSFFGSTATMLGFSS
jgi:hypothetical protein